MPVGAAVHVAAGESVSVVTDDVDILANRLEVVTIEDIKVRPAHC
eukprot:COSAG06_NODE_53122_length_302_cov_0.270936_1_plen_44_part_01